MATRSATRKTNLSPSKILDTVYAFRSARVLLTAFELDLFTALGDSAKTSAEVARKLRTNARATDRLMDALCALGFLLKRRGKFANTPLTAQFLVKGKESYMGGLMHQVSLWKTWSTLTEAVRTGSAVLGRDSVNNRGVDWLAAFIAAMHMRATHQAHAVLKLLDLRGVKRVLDVGGGSGVFSMAFVRAKPGIHSVVFDLPNVVGLTRTYIQAENLEDLITTAEGDYTVDQLGTGFDLVFLSAVIHSNSPQTNKRLFKKAYDALNPKGQLVVSDFIMNEDRTSPAFGALFSLNMLVGTQEGDTFTESEVRSWMEDAHFTRITRKATPFGSDLMIGRKK